jgi:hypothetical protein
VSQFLPAVSSHFKEGVGSSPMELIYPTHNCWNPPAGSNFQAQQTDEPAECRRTGKGQAGGSNATGNWGTAAFVQVDREAKEAEDSG